MGDFLYGEKGINGFRNRNEKTIDGDVKTERLYYIEQYNRESGLRMQRVINEPRAFQ